ncbi:hypothetical protein [Prochlorococcus marinus]|nr:hypothetical protein [Prochlorococcus marinus]
MNLSEFVRNQPWRIWVFVIALNIVAFLGMFFLKMKGIDLYSFRGGT